MASQPGRPRELVLRLLGKKARTDTDGQWLDGLGRLLDDHEQDIEELAASRSVCPVALSRDTCFRLWRRRKQAASPAWPAVRETFQKAAADLRHQEDVRAALRRNGRAVAEIAGRQGVPTRELVQATARVSLLHRDRFADGYTWPALEPLVRAVATDLCLGYRFAREGLAAAKEAFTRLRDLYGGAVLSVMRAFGLPEKDQEDRCQDVWLKLWQARPRFRAGRYFWFYASRVAQNVAIDYKRRQARRPEAPLPDEQTLPERNGKSSDPELRDLVEAVHRKMKELFSEDEIRLLRQRIEEGLKLRELPGGVPSTVWRRLNDMLARLRQYGEDLLGR